jgi:putative MATE family efflux protein
MQDLTTGPVTRHLIKTSSFMLVTMVVQTLYFLVDLYWVGRLGTDAVAAVGIAGNISFVVLALTQMLGVGTTTLVSHAAGQKDHERGLLVFNQSQVLSTIAGAFVFIVGLATRRAYTASVGADAVTADMANDYLLWFMPAMGLQFLMVAMGAALRGLGQFKPGMIVSSASILLNMALAPFLIFGWGTGHPLGVAGAAISTLVAVAVAVVWLTTYFVQKDAFLTFTPRDWAPRLDIWKRMLAIGLPSGMEFALMALYMVVVYAIIKPFGAEAQAGFGIGGRVVQAAFMPVVALGFAVAPVAGQNVGAKLGARVRETFRSAVLMSIAVTAVLAVFIYVTASSLISVFSSDPRVIGVGTEYLKIVAWTFVASGLNFVNSSMFQALGNTVPSLATSAVRMLVVIVPTVLLSTRADFAMRWIWYLSIASVVVQLLLGLWLLQGEMTKKMGVALS